jgi:hypothetical protein
VSWRSSPVTGPGLPRAAGRLKPWRSHSAARVSLLLACRAARALNTRHKMTKFCTLGSCMRIEINYQAETLETAICEAIVTYLGYGMAACFSIVHLLYWNFLPRLGKLLNTRWNFELGDGDARFWSAHGTSTNP